jgi:hypothetical protein
MNPSDFMQYVRRDWPVLPIEPGTKCIRWDLLESQSADYYTDPARADEIAQWAAAGATIAVALKGTGLAVLDIDERDLGRAWIEENGGWPETPRVRTPHGWHVYFKVTGAMYAGVVEVDGEKIADFLVDRQCYVLAPPTPGYEWEGDRAGHAARRRADVGALCCGQKAAG